MAGRYSLTKLLNVMFARGLTERLPPSSPLLIDSVNSGFCYSAIRQNVTFPLSLLTGFMELMLARQTDEGAKTLVWAAVAGSDNVAVQDSLKGAYTSDCRVEEPSDFLLSKEGEEVEKKIWVSNFMFFLVC
jgi:retinol dehydrogenase 12